MKEIHRQKDDQQFGSVLDRVRIGEQKDEYIDYLMTRNHESKSTCPRDSMYIFTNNVHCHEHNELMLNALGTSVVQIDSRQSNRLIKYS